MTPEERFELNKGWAEGLARKRHSKLKAVLAAYQVPTIEELTNAALEGLWNACLTYYGECQSFRYHGRSKVNAEFTRLRREYAKYISQGRDNVHGGSSEMENVVAAGRVREVRGGVREAKKRGKNRRGSKVSDDCEVRDSDREETGPDAINRLFEALGIKPVRASNESGI